MTKVVLLAHVKASASSSSSGAGSRRIPWLGGKLVSNKEEALRKFYERKVSAGGAFNDRQIDALQKSRACPWCWISDSASRTEL